MHAPIGWIVALASLAIAGCPAPTTLADDAVSAPDGGRDAGAVPHDGAMADVGHDAATTVDAGLDAARAPDAGADATTIADAGPDAHATGAGSGLVALTQQVGGSCILSGFFAPTDIDSLERGLLVPTCSIVAEMGACRVVSCPTVTSLDAGNVRASLHGSSFAIATRGALGFYLQTVSGTALSSAGGDVVTLDDGTGGADVPAFTLDVTAPAFPTVTLPTSIDRSADLVITWGTTTAGSIQIVLGQGTSLATQCIVDGSAGTATIPAALVGRYATGSGVLAFTAYDVVRVTTGGYVIDGEAGLATEVMPTFF